MDITKMLTISTAHVTEDTIILLERVVTTFRWHDAFPLVVYGKHSVVENGFYGFLICMPEDVEEMLEDTSGVPEDLIRCLLIAEANDCQWLCLDRDGEVIEGLEAFEW